MLYNTKTYVTTIYFIKFSHFAQIWMNVYVLEGRCAQPTQNASTQTAPSGEGRGCPEGQGSGS